MTSKERVIAALESGRTDRPLFCPAIYEHKARLISASVSQVAQNVDLMINSLLAEYEIYEPDMLTVGIDVYNIEAEALGCQVIFPDAIDAVPAIAERILAHAAKTDDLPQIDVEKTRRIPLMLETAQKVQRKLGDKVFVRGAVTGPYSMAAELMGTEELILATMTRADQVEEILEFCTDVAINYGKAFLARDVEVCIFDSQTAPPLMSPDTYKRLVLPCVQNLIGSLKSLGATFVEYVVGGDTSTNVNNIFDTGADIVLSDFSSDLQAFLNQAKAKLPLIRRNISPALIECGRESELINQAAQVAHLARTNPQVIVGTGVLSYNTSIERVLLVRDALMNESTN